MRCRGTGKEAIGLNRYRSRPGGALAGRMLAVSRWRASGRSTPAGVPCASAKFHVRVAPLDHVGAGAGVLRHEGDAHASDQLLTDMEVPERVNGSAHSPVIGQQSGSLDSSCRFFFTEHSRLSVGTANTGSASLVLLDTKGGGREGAPPYFHSGRNLSLIAGRLTCA